MFALKYRNQLKVYTIYLTVNNYVLYQIDEHLLKHVLYIIGLTTSFGLTTKRANIIQLIKGTIKKIN